jgi:hypothetical protein
MIWIADAHRGDGKRFIVRADEKLSAFAFRRFPCRLLWLPKTHRTNVQYTTLGSTGKFVLDYVIRRFNLSSARLNKPQGLDLR